MSAQTLFVRRVQSNVKKGVDAELSRLTLLVGPNGSGKTSVQNAIELAACGFASDVEGRAKVKKGDMLAKLGPATATPLMSEIEFSDGRKAKWKLTPNKRGGYHEPEHVSPTELNVVFPVQEVREILGGSADTIRMWLMSRVGSTVREVDVVDKLPDDVQDVYRERARKLRRDGMNEVDILLAVIESSEKEARVLDAESKTAKQVIDTMRRTTAKHRRSLSNIGPTSTQWGQPPSQPWRTSRQRRKRHSWLCPLCLPCTRQKRRSSSSAPRWRTSAP